MAKSKIKFTFNDGGEHGSSISFRIYKIVDPLVYVDFIETWNTAGRTNNYLIPLSSGLDQEIESAFNYFSYLQLDYGAIGLFTPIDYNPALSVVELEAIDETWAFSVNNINLIEVDTEIINSDYDESAYTLDNVIISEADIDKCGKFKISLETSEIADSIKLNGISIASGNILNPFIFEINRDLPFKIELFNTTLGETLIHEDKNGLPSFNIENIDITIINSLIGATLTINIGNDLESLGLQYSLDDINWQDSNVFNGQPNGGGEVFVKDIYGCKKSALYEVKDLGTRKPFLFLSKANSINFIMLEDIDDYEVFKNNENSFTSLNNINYCLPNLFKPKDKTRIQFKSNFEKVEVFLRDELENNTLLTLEKKTANLNSFQKMDCIIYKYKSNELGIYFNQGKTYSELNVENGDYELNGNLPDMAVIGNYITITNIGTFEIKNVLFDSNIQKKVMIIDYTYEGVPLDSIVESRYDLLPYEIYEFEVDWNLYSTGFYDIYIENSNSQIVDEVEVFEDKYILQSYNIHVSDNHNNTLAVAYWNENNRDIFYKYGIKHFKRVPFVNVEVGVLDDSDLNIGDLTTNLNSSSVYELDRFIFTDLTDEEMRTLVIALSCENVFINGIGYLKNGNLGVEPIENTNLHEVVAEMIKTNINYNTNTRGQEGVDDGYLPFDIPTFIDANGTFIKV